MIDWEPEKKMFYKVIAPQCESRILNNYNQVATILISNCRICRTGQTFREEKA